MIKGYLGFLRKRFKMPFCVYVILKLNNNYDVIYVKGMKNYDIFI